MDAGRGGIPGRKGSPDGPKAWQRARWAQRGWRDDIALVEYACQPDKVRAMAEIRQLVPRGHYLANEVGRLAGVSGLKIGQWARRGYIRSSHSSGQPRVYSFQDVAEAMVVHELIDVGVPLSDIKSTVAKLREAFGDWPLTAAPIATAPSGTDHGGRTWARLLVSFDDTAYEETHGTWQQVAESNLRSVTANLRRGGWAARNLPDLRHIEVNPDRLSGRPTVVGRRIPVEKVASLADRPGGMQTLREDYGLSDDEIRDSQRWWQATTSYEAMAA